MDMTYKGYVCGLAAPQKPCRCALGRALDFLDMKDTILIMQWPQKNHVNSS